MLIKEHKENGYYIAIEYEKTNIYKVSVYPCHSDGLCGYPIKETIYPLTEKKKAMNTYYRYIRKYCKGLD